MFGIMDMCMEGDRYPSANRKFLKLFIEAI